jgi:hypothetical protein
MFDRLTRDACFLFGLEKAGVEFLAADMPYANRLAIGVMALVAGRRPVRPPPAPKPHWPRLRHAARSWATHG